MRVIPALESQSFALCKLPVHPNSVDRFVKVIVPIPVRFVNTVFDPLIVSVTRRTTVRDSVNVVDDFYDIYG